MSPREFVYIRWDDKGLFALDETNWLCLDRMSHPAFFLHQMSQRDFLLHHMSHRRSDGSAFFFFTSDESVWIYMHPICQSRFLQIRWAGEVFFLHQMSPWVCLYQLSWIRFVNIRWICVGLCYPRFVYIRWVCFGWFTSDECPWVCLHEMHLPECLHQMSLLRCFYIRWVPVFALDEFTWVCLHQMGLHVVFVCVCFTLKEFMNLWNWLTHCIFLCISNISRIDCFFFSCFCFHFGCKRVGVRGVTPEFKFFSR